MYYTWVRYMQIKRERNNAWIIQPWAIWRVYSLEPLWISPIQRWPFITTDKPRWKKKEVKFTISFVSRPSSTISFSLPQFESVNFPNLKGSAATKKPVATRKRASVDSYMWTPPFSWVRRRRTNLAFGILNVQMPNASMFTYRWKPREIQRRRGPE